MSILNYKKFQINVLKTTINLIFWNGRSINYIKFNI